MRKLLKKIGSAKGLDELTDGGLILEKRGNLISWPGEKVPLFELETAGHLGLDAVMTYRGVGLGAHRIWSSLKGLFPGQ
jgi:hypothetical protein